MRVFLSAGEASGDAYGGEIFRALVEHGAFSAESLARDLVSEMLTDAKGDLARAARDISRTYALQDRTSLARTQWTLDDLVHVVSSLVASGRIETSRLLKESVAAVGGRRLSEAGVGLVADSSTWGAVGILESLLVGPRALEGYLTAKNVLKISGPGVFIPIDFGYVNIKLARQAKRFGWKVLYFVPPGSWRRTKQGKDLPQLTDAIVCPFPWSADILNSMGGQAHFFGHPLRQMVAKADYDGLREGLAILPGSRLHEVARNMGVIADATRGLDVPLQFAVASSLETGDLEREWENLGGAPAEFSRDTYRVLKSSRAAIVCSGTATLEAALCGCPLVVMYRLAPWALLEYAIRRPQFKFVSLPNILLDREAVPELLQQDATAVNIRTQVDQLLGDGPERSAQLAAFAELEGLLGDGDVFGSTAELAIKLANDLQSRRS